MALLFLDGFDHYGTGTSPVTTGKWLSAAQASASATQVRTGTHAMGLGTAFSTLISKPVTTSGGAVVGVAWQTSGAFFAGDLIQVMEGAIVHVALGITTGGVLQIKRGATVLATGTTVLPSGAWVFLELKTVIADAAGTYGVRIDGVPEASLTATGQDTRNAGTGVWDRIFLGPTSNLTTYYDDFYLCDTSGSAPRNTFLGSVKVETLYPQTDAVAVGSHAGLTPSTGTDHGALVDEATPNTTDYNSSATVGQKDTYQYPSLALTGTVLGVQTNLYAMKTDAVARQVCAVVRAGGVDYDGANVSPVTTFSYLSEVRAQNPNTAADWTTADIATLQAGMKVTA